MEIRKPNDTELQQIITLSPQALFEGTLGKAQPTRTDVEKILSPLLEKGCYYLVAVEQEQLMGWVLLGASKDQFTGISIGFIYELFVGKTFRKKGVARKLITDAIEHLKTAGYPEVRLSAFAGNPAIKLYKEMGFSVRNVTMNLEL